MTGELVKRLETHAYAPNFTSVGAANLMLEAKARLEALEAEKARLADVLRQIVDHDDVAFGPYARDLEHLVHSALSSNGEAAIQDTDSHHADGLPAAVVEKVTQPE